MIWHDWFAIGEMEKLQPQVLRLPTLRSGHSG
jgi:hypothetical protein